MAADLEGLVRQVLENQAASKETVKGMEKLLTEARQDARAAREGLAEIKAVLGEQNVPERVAEIRAEMKAQHVELRTDMVNTYNRLQAAVADRGTALDVRIDGLDKRVAALERLKEQATGAKSVLGWLLKHAPWLFAGIAAFLAGMGWEHKIT